MSDKIIFPITAIAKPRMVASDRYRNRPKVMRYREYKNQFSYYQGKVEKVRELLDTPTKIVFHLPMPKSWSKRKKEQHNGQPHLQVPDVDNLLKGFLDAILKEDKSVWSIWCEKRWADLGRIQVSRIEI